MSFYIRIDDKADLDWFLRLIQNSLANPSTPKLQDNIEHLLNWDRYLRAPVKMKEVVATVVAPEEILSAPDLTAAKKQKVAEQRKEMERKRASKKKKGAVAGKQRKKVPEEVPEVDPFTCSKHSTYHGLRAARNADCDECWELYAIRNGHVQSKHAREKLRRRLAITN